MPDGTERRILALARQRQLQVPRALLHRHRWSALYLEGGKLCYRRGASPHPVGMECIPAAPGWHLPL